MYPKTSYVREKQLLKDLYDVTNSKWKEKSNLIEINTQIHHIITELKDRLNTIKQTPDMETPLQKAYIIQRIETALYIYDTV